MDRFPDRRPLLFLVLSVWLSSAHLWGASNGKSSSSSPTNTPALRYPRASAPQAATNRVQALHFADATRRLISPTMHVLESEHFLICTEWNPAYDVSLANLCERMYQRLSEQFQVSPSENVWVGKCPVYLFWDPAHYARFISEVDHSRTMDAAAARANGYHATHGPFSYIVINGVADFGRTQAQARSEFYHVLVHEGTHAFLHRYVTNRPLPLWVEEGLADFIAASLVPESEVNLNAGEAVREALDRPRMLKQLLEKHTDLTPIEYGLAENVIQFLVSNDRRAMVKFIELLKRGEDQEAALEQSYRASQSDLVRAWRFDRERQLRRPSLVGRR